VEITGPFLDETKKLIGRPACWYLRYSAPKRNADGILVLAENGRPVIQRYRPFYETKAEALADIPRISYSDKLYDLHLHVEWVIRRLEWARGAASASSP
jgi:hypothetical protein